MKKFLLFCSVISFIFGIGYHGACVLKYVHPSNEGLRLANTACIFGSFGIALCITVLILRSSPQKR